MSQLDTVVGELASWVQSEPGSFRLVCEVTRATGEDPTPAFGSALPVQVAELWRLVAEARLFADCVDGQWGLRILPVPESRERTARERAARPADHAVGDVVLGEFLGDSDLLVVNSAGTAMVALPLDPRDEWYEVGATVHEFLVAYLRAEGDKFWERRA